MDMEYKVFNDLVHGHMEFHPLVAAVIDTPQVQRLRNVKQLGPCSFVYPSAVHSRFEHSLGTAFLAGKLFDSLKEKRTPSDVTDELWEKRKLCAQIAGLCHDLGHGPFSHTWEEFKKRCKDKWKHETESLKIFDEILLEKRARTKSPNTIKDLFSFYNLHDEDIEVIKSIIIGEKNRKNYLFQVICNKDNHIDVDKWEYLARDSVMLNIPIGFDYKRLLKYCCILQNSKNEEEICFREKEAPVLLEMFLARGKLHDVAYQHTKVKIIEEMMLDAFLLANERLKLQWTPITQLTDHIYQKILYEDFGNDRKMAKAKDILRRIEKRNLYQCILQESYENEFSEKLSLLRNLLKDVEGMEPFIEQMKVTSVAVHMTKANRNKALSNVLVYEKVNNSNVACKAFNWDNYQDCLKPDVTNLKRNQILLLYTGEEEFPKELKEKVRKIFKENF